MADDDPVARVALAIADGEPVDWEAEIAAATTPEEAEQLKNLQLIWAITAQHASDSSVEPPLPSAPPPTPPPSSSADDGRWGRYELFEELGAGNFGQVRRGRDTELGREVAIKLFQDDALRQRVLREGQLLARLKDPNIVTVWDVGEHGGRLGLVMEFIQGETLDDVLRSRGTLNVREAVLVGQDVLRALAAAHAAGLIHRDVKARNIMRDRGGRIVLMDFGAGSELAEPLVGAAGQMVGTPLSMAPEVLGGQQASIGSDLYSVGVLLYYLVTGKYPVSGRTLQDIRLAHMYGNRTPISHRRTDLPQAFVRIVDRALIANPAERYAAAAGMLDDLSLAIVPPAPAPPPPAMGPLLKGLLAAAAVVAGVTAVGALVSSSFNTTMGRSDFATEGVVEWFGWGLSSLLQPVAFGLFAVIGIALCHVCKEAVFRVSPGARGWSEALSARIRGLGLDNVDLLCGGALVVSIAMVGGAFWYHLDLLGALFITPDVSSATVEQLARLSPSSAPAHISYRESLTVVMILCMAMWSVPVWLARKRRQTANRTLLASGVAVLLIALFLTSFPYRLLTRNGNFVTVEWKGDRCYLLGQRNDEALIFCPEHSVPRNHVVSPSELRRTGEPESPFTPFGRTKAGEYKESR